MAIPLQNPETLAWDVMPILTSAPGPLPVPVQTFEGTGFLLGHGLLVTCWHCIAVPAPSGSTYSASRPTPEGFKGLPLFDIRRLGKDLAAAHIGYRARLGFVIAKASPKMGDAVWTFGYPLTDIASKANAEKQFILNPRLLRGHILRPFEHDHPSLGLLPSWELSFAVPGGLSGAPLFREDTLEVVGVIYGNNDVAVVEEQSTVDASGARTPELQRILSFGLALHLSELTPLRDVTPLDPTPLLA